MHSITTIGLDIANSEPSTHGTKRTIRQRPRLSPIGATTDKARHRASAARPRLTHKRHWLCTAAIGLMPISAPIKVLV